MMKCKYCGTENALLKKVCINCQKILEGRCINNVTGKSGYRNADGTFTESYIMSNVTWLTNNER